MLLNHNIEKKDAEKELFFTIVHSNDEHSALLPAPCMDYSLDEPDTTVGGIARIATLVKEIRNAKAAVNEPVLVISGGDFMGGSPFSWLAFRDMAAELSLMIELGYDIVTLGNHELDFNAETLARYLKAAGYPDAAEKTAIVTSNLKTSPDHPLSHRGIENIHIRELTNGLKAGFFGLYGKDAITVSPFKESVEFLDQHEVAASAVEELKLHGADVIIAINHLGIKEDLALVREVPGIDVIIGGHCHSATEEPITEGKTIIVQALELYKKLGVLELTYNPVTKQVRVRNRETGQPFLLDINDTIPADPHINELLAYYSGELGKMAKELTGGMTESIFDVMVKSDFDLPAFIGRESPMGNFITDAIRFAAEEALGKKVDFSFFASGIIRGSLVTGKMPFSKGNINFFELADRVSLGSGLDDSPGFPLVSAYLTAGEIRRIFEISAFLTRYMSEYYFIVCSGLRARYDFKRAVLRLPFVNQLLPTTRGTLSVDVFTGEGVQNGDDESYIPLDKHGQKLYHVVCDYGIAGAIPIVGERVFYLKLQPKDREGNPVTLENAIIYRNGKELKVWQAVIEYAVAQPRGKDGIPRIPDAYNGNSGRLTEARGTPLYVWPLVILSGILALIILLT